MPYVSPTRKDFGDPLVSPGHVQPKSTLNIDAYGVAQGQLTWALNASDANIQLAIAHFQAGAEWPFALGFSMRSYKYSYGFDKGGVCMLTVDYMGIVGGDYSKAQITGVSTCSSQPIETHPNFTKILNSQISTNVLAGVPSSPKNQAIFRQVEGTAQYSFGGFGVGLTADGTPNRKAGVKQYLRPMTNVRGTIFCSKAYKTAALNLLSSVGKFVGNTSDLNRMWAPLNSNVSDPGKYVLITSANYECIGNPAAEYAAIKMTYDLMVVADGAVAGLGWDPDIYAQASAIF
jgi:hypothetical protein